MSFPDTETRATEIEFSHPESAKRLRQYYTLCSNFEKQIQELQTQNAALVQQLIEAAKTIDALTTERDNLKQQIPAEQPQPESPTFEDRLSAIESRLSALEKPQG